MGHKVFNVMSNTSNIKPSRGRPAGSNSFVKIKLSDLAQLVGAGMQIPVSKVWMREMGFSIEEPAATILPTTQPAIDEPKIEFTLTKMEDND
jgi:hypothetical protein